MKKSQFVFQIALLAACAVLFLTAFILREALHIHRQLSVFAGILVGGIVLMVILRVNRRAGRRPGNEDE